MRGRSRPRRRARAGWWGSSSLVLRRWTRGLRCACKLLARVEIEKRIGLVVETRLDDGERRVPVVDLAPAACEEGGEVREKIATGEREHRVRLVERSRDRELRIRGGERRGEAR